MAGVLYHLFIGRFERAVRERQRSETPEQQATSELTLSIVRRTVLTVDLLAFAAVGYWLGLTFGE